MRRTLLTLCSAICFFAFAQSALAGGGSFDFTGGTPKEQATVRSALAAPASQRAAVGAFPPCSPAGASSEGGAGVNTSGDQPVAERARHGLRARVGVELVHRLADVRAHRLGRDEEPLADLLVREAVGEQPEDVPLALRELRAASRPNDDAASVPASTGSTYVVPPATVCTARSRSSIGRLLEHEARARLRRAPRSTSARSP